jgi:hypothetical protein
LTGRRPSWFLIGDRQIIDKEKDTMADDLGMALIELLREAEVEQ